MMIINKSFRLHIFSFFLIFSVLGGYLQSAEILENKVGNFGLPGIIDLPTGKKLPNGELVFTQQIHNSLSRTGISFQALDKLGFSFRYSGHGRNGTEAHGRINHDRSFDAHLTIWEEGKYKPAVSIGLRDFIGTGWYSSEYIVGTKTIGNLQVSTGLGFGRLAGRDTFKNPFLDISSSLAKRGSNKVGRGGTLGTINWFHGPSSLFGGLVYKIGEKLDISAEYTSDIMDNEGKYLAIKSPWNFGINYQVNDLISLSTQYLHGSTWSFTTNLKVNPERPPYNAGMELAPVPMRLRDLTSENFNETNKAAILKVLKVDGFKVIHLSEKEETVTIYLENSKFRSTAQAIGRVTSTLQRFTSNQINTAFIIFVRDQLRVGNYKVDLKKVTIEQFSPFKRATETDSIVPVAWPNNIQNNDIKGKLSWSLGPYVDHRLFNPDLPLSMELGADLRLKYFLTNNLAINSSLRKSLITNFTKNERRSNSVLPRVHSDWPLYDQKGQDGHIHSLTLSQYKNLAPNLYGRAEVGLLEPFFAGFSGELLYKPSKSSFAIGLDLHYVRKRQFEMLFDLREYKTKLGHLSLYYDFENWLDLELNLGRYLAGDWGSTLNLSRKFANGWEVGGYATLTDVPFDKFGEGSFDKAIYVSIPMDWIIGSPNTVRRKLTIRPITRDGGAQLASARKLYGKIKDFQNTSFKREYGRLWK